MPPSGPRDRFTSSRPGVARVAFRVTEVQKALKGANYPMDGPVLSDLAKSNGADQDLVEALRGLREVEGPNGVMKELTGDLGARPSTASQATRARGGGGGSSRRRSANTSGRSIPNLSHKLLQVEVNPQTSAVVEHEVPRPVAEPGEESVHTQLGEGGEDPNGRPGRHAVLPDRPAPGHPTCTQTKISVIVEPFGALLGVAGSVPAT